jgi:hypothetical protein
MQYHQQQAFEVYNRSERDTSNASTPQKDRSNHLGVNISDQLLHHDDLAYNIIPETLLGLLGCATSESVISHYTEDALSTLNSFFGQKSPASLDMTMSSRASLALSESAVKVAMQLCRIATSNGENKKSSKKQTWQALQNASSTLQRDSSPGNALAISVVYGALSLILTQGGQEAAASAKAAASALSSITSRNKGLRHDGSVVANRILKSYLIHSSFSDHINLTILTHFARAFKITQEQDAEYPQFSANAIQYTLTGNNDRKRTFAIPYIDHNAMYELEKQKVSSALSLASQIGPWPVLAPVTLVEAATPYDFWDACQKLLISSYSSCPEETKTATNALITAAIEARYFRLADNMATKLYHQGGKSLYVEARLYHAIGTISKVIAKRQLPIIERQVERVDKAVEKVKLELASITKMEEDEDSEGDEDSSSWLLAGKEIRDFCLTKLSENGELASAHRLAKLWEMDYIFDEEAIKKASEAKRKLYMQWDEALPPGTPLPELVSDPISLKRGFQILMNDGGPFGMDAEWDEEYAGVCLFQLASLKNVLLLDIPSLSSTNQGILALHETIGALFSPDGINIEVVGFAPRQDLSRLRASLNSEHWLNSHFRTIIDAQLVIGQHNPRLRTLGLSRVTNEYLGKPLDKAEQCSLWSARPLSASQRIYAALDAWVCCAIYKKLTDTSDSSSSGEI